MNEISIQFFKSKYGELILGSFEEQLCLCDWKYRKLRSRIDQNILKGLDAKFIEHIQNTSGQFDYLRTTALPSDSILPATYQASMNWINAR